MRRLYVLDWRGTLTILGEINEIKAFLDKIHARGDFTVGFSGRPPPEAHGLFTFGNFRKDWPGLFERLAVGESAREWEIWGDESFPADRFSDPNNPKQDFDPRQIKEIVFCDDDNLLEKGDWFAHEWAERLGREDLRFRVVEPEDLHLEV